MEGPDKSPATQTAKIGGMSQMNLPGLTRRQHFPQSRPLANCKSGKDARYNHAFGQPDGTLQGKTCSREAGMALPCGFSALSAMD